MEYTPAEAWFSALGAKVSAYREAKKAGKYSVSDLLRKELVSNGVIDLDSNPRWHPVFESVESRSERLACLPR